MTTDEDRQRLNDAFAAWSHAHRMLLEAERRLHSRLQDSADLDQEVARLTAMVIRLRRRVEALHVEAMELLQSRNGSS
jgi:hypothetical protein